jgi:hypothetical protein
MLKAWKVTGSIPHVTEFFNSPNPSSPESTQLLTEMCTRNLPEGKGWTAACKV